MYLRSAESQRFTRQEKRDKMVIANLQATMIGHLNSNLRGPPIVLSPTNQPARAYISLGETVSQLMALQKIGRYHRETEFD